MVLKSKSSIAVIIPAYNEEKVIGRCIDAVVKVIETTKFPIKIIVVNDGSIDKTSEILTDKAKDYKKYLIVVTHKKNRGYGGATQTGITTALKMGFTWAIHMDSDLTNDPKYIRTFAGFVDQNFDCIKASRYIKGSSVENVPYFRRLVSIIGNFIAVLMFHIGINDCTNGFRMVRLSKVKGLKFKENNFSIILEELLYLKQKHASFTEIPYKLTARNNSKSHFNYKPRIFIDYLKYALKSLLVW